MANQENSVPTPIDWVDLRIIVTSWQPVAFQGPRCAAARLEIISQKEPKEAFKIVPVEHGNPEQVLVIPIDLTAPTTPLQISFAIDGSAVGSTLKIVGIYFSRDESREEAKVQFLWTILNRGEANSGPKVMGIDGVDYDIATIPVDGMAVFDRRSHPVDGKEGLGPYHWYTVVLMDQFGNIGTFDPGVQHDYTNN